MQPSVLCNAGGAARLYCTCAVAEDVACDSSSPVVRLAVVQGLGGLVDNPLAQPLLKMVLPKLGPLLHDKALKVRTAVADLLLAVM